MNNVDKLLYEKANTYRLHADNLRWTLLGGYGAFFAAVMFQLKDNPIQQDFQTAALFFILFCVSILYLFILAVQSWYYNLFSEYVEHCEKRLIEEKRLVSLSAFTDSNREDVPEEIKVKDSITPLHPAFSFALYVIALTSIGFLLPVVRYLFFMFKFDFQQNIAWVVGFSILLFVVYVTVFNLMFRNWQKFAYPLIAFLFIERSRPSKEEKH